MATPRHTVPYTHGGISVTSFTTQSNFMTNDVSITFLKFFVVLSHEFMVKVFNIVTSCNNNIEVSFNPNTCVVTVGQGQSISRKNKQDNSLIIIFGINSWSYGKGWPWIPSKVSLGPAMSYPSFPFGWPLVKLPYSR
jgi:hypothetical protein